MHDWYDAICDEHEEACPVFINRNGASRAYIYVYDDKAKELAGTWLSLHWGCALRLIHRDDEIDKVIDTYIYADESRASWPSGRNVLRNPGAALTTTPIINELFAAHALNDTGLNKVDAIKRAFSDCLTAVEAQIHAGRESAMVRTHLQEACFMAVRAVAVQPGNQQ